jgi:putative holliday junction resolvase
VRGALPTIEVVEQDEALTTWEADERLKAQGLSPQERRTKIDMYAAAVLLQEWLDHRR